jgi:hypothetical protein
MPLRTNVFYINPDFDPNLNDQDRRSLILIRLFSLHQPILQSVAGPSDEHIPQHSTCEGTRKTQLVTKLCKKRKDKKNYASGKDSAFESSS